MPRLTKSYVDRLQPRARRYDVYCDSLRGFTVRVNADGTKTAGFRYLRDGARHRVTIGVLGDGFTLDRARRKAEKLRGQVQDGAHPAHDRDERRNAPTFGEVADRYMSEIAKPYRKASTSHGYERLLRNHLRPALGSMKIGDITRDDVQRLHQRIGETAPGAANRALALVSVIMTNAERWGLRDTRSNPCHRMEKFAERKMERFLSPEERARLDAVLAEGEACKPGQKRYIGPATIAALRLLLMTGARLGEIIGLQWSMVDLERSCLRLPDSKTGAKVIPLSPHTVDVLRALDAKRSPGESWVCPRKQGGGPLQNFEGSWQAVRERAGLDDVRLHDLRHSAASDMLAAGMTLAEIGIVLGHKSTQTSARYAHCSESGRRNIGERMGEAIDRSSREGAERLREKEKEQQRAAGAEGGEASEGGDAIAAEQQRAVGAEGGEASEGGGEVIMAERQQERAVGGEGGGDASDGGEVIAIGGGAKVIPLRPRSKR
jgi:integrase